VLENDDSSIKTGRDELLPDVPLAKLRQSEQNTITGANDDNANFENGHLS
jgi:hypothetical protein